MTGKDKERPSSELSDQELEMFFGRRDEGPDMVKSVSEGFDRVLDEVLVKNREAPVKEEDGGRDK